MWVVRRYNRGECYIGQVDDQGRKAGIGLHIYDDCYGYAGEWQEGLFSGRGVLVCQDNSYYVGEFKQGRRVGIGKLRFPDSEFLGEFHDSKNGFGEIFTSRGTHVAGFFSSDSLHGNALVYDPLTQYRLEGKFEFGVCSGLCCESAQLHHFIGYLASGVRKGPGKLTLQQEEKTVIGTFSGELTKGVCSIQTPESTYVGEARNYCKEGVGRETGPGWEFVGEFAADRRHGFGMFRDAEVEFIGEWRAGEKSGVGVQTTQKSNLKEKELFYGKWQQGKREGPGFEKVGPREYQGGFKDDKYHGVAMLQLTGEQKTFGQFIHGSLVRFAADSEFDWPRQELAPVGGFLEGAREFIAKIRTKIAAGFEANKYRELDRPWTKPFEGRELETRSYYSQQVVAPLQQVCSRLREAAKSQGLGPEFEELFGQASLERVLPDRLISFVDKQQLRENAHLVQQPATAKGEWSEADQELDMTNFMALLEASVSASFDADRANPVADDLDFSKYRFDPHNLSLACHSHFAQANAQRPRRRHRREVYSPPPKTASPNKFEMLKLEEVFPRRGAEAQVKFASSRCYEFSDEYLRLPEEGHLVQEVALPDPLDLGARKKEELSFDNLNFAQIARPDASGASLDSRTPGEQAPAQGEPSKEEPRSFQTLSRFSSHPAGPGADQEHSYFPASQSLRKKAQISAYMKIIDEIELDSLPGKKQPAESPAKSRRGIAEEIYKLQEELESLANRDLRLAVKLKPARDAQPVWPEDDFGSSVRMVSKEITFVEDESLA